MNKRNLQLMDYQMESTMSNAGETQVMTEEEIGQQTTACDGCGKTGPINSTNYDPIEDKILCPKCDLEVSEKRECEV